MRLIRCVDMLLGSGEHAAALYILGVVHDACSCVLLRMAAYGCVWLRVGCVRLRVIACGCVWCGGPDVYA